MKHRINPSPHEDVEQTSLFIWAAYNTGKWPELELMYHIPNGGSRNKAEAARLQAQGVRPGVPDICMPVARNGHHGLYIELKRQKGGRLTEKQKEWIDALLRQGYFACRCDGWEAASLIITQYLEEQL